MIVERNALRREEPAFVGVAARFDVFSGVAAVVEGGYRLLFALPVVGLSGADHFENVYFTGARP